MEKNEQSKLDKLSMDLEFAKNLTEDDQNKIDDLENSGGKKKKNIYFTK